MNQPADAPVSITSARASRSADIRRREVRYLMSMGIRTVCFVGAYFASGPFRWTLVGAAVFLPYIAVVIANAADQRYGQEPAAFLGEQRPMLEAGPDPAGDDSRGTRPAGGTEAAEGARGTEGGP